MAFSASDRSKVEGLLSKLTTAMDGVGRSKRDLDLVLKLNQHWASGVRGAIIAYMNYLKVVLDAADSLETGIIEAMDAISPPEPE